MAFFTHLRWPWTPTKESGARAEEALFSFAPRRVPPTFRDTSIDIGDGNDQFLHSVEAGNDNDVALVATAGYAAGSGCLFGNLDALSSGFHVYLVDMLGWGLSSRPYFSATDTASAEAFFVDALESWRKVRGLESFILVGHSLGGYLSFCYALKYPHRIIHLVLIGPAGFATRPAARPPANTLLARAARWAWNRDVTPGLMMRAAGPLGKTIMEKLVRERFDRFLHTRLQDELYSDAKRAALTEYMYQIMASRGSSEFALRLIMAPGGWPRQPLLDRASSLRSPTTLCYGAHDWVDYREGERLAASLRSRGISAELMRIPHAGHHVYLDAPQAFNCAVLRAIRYLVKKKTSLARVDASIASGSAHLAGPFVLPDFGLEDDGMVGM